MCVAEEQKPDHNKFQALMEGHLQQLGAFAFGCEAMLMRHFSSVYNQAYTSTEKWSTETIRRVVTRHRLELQRKLDAYTPVESRSLFP